MIAEQATTQAPESQIEKVRQMLISSIMRGGVTSFDIAFIVSDNGHAADFKTTCEALDSLVAEGSVKVRGDMPQRYSLTWGYWFRNVFDYTV
jgi:hypothetical protein